MPFNPIPDNWIPPGHADNGGDVIFILKDQLGLTHSLSPYLTQEPAPTDDQCRMIKVSSYILSRASHVFEAMFDPRFTNGANLSSSSPYEVPLPEDDCQAMVWLCFALHSQELPGNQIPLDLSKRLATLCDKYDCARALQPWSCMWLHKLRISMAYDGDWQQLLWMAHLFQDRQAFGSPRRVWCMVRSQGTLLSMRKTLLASLSCRAVYVVCESQEEYVPFDCRSAWLRCS